MKQAIIITDPSHIEFIRKAIRDEFDKCKTVGEDISIIDMARKIGLTDLAEEMEKDSIHHYTY